eukprot:TRINITY_DN4442_c0_g1_i3.p1 TRINITY_DN4442_c0_g1~~TRINITY_DN4442_c0_g1_i3.p1  ORF type:complete len:198 (-),score=20.58 TRINITY_DN4442_c0_g1_i3:95-688(-)
MMRSYKNIGKEMFRELDIDLRDRDIVECSREILTCFSYHAQYLEFLGTVFKDSEDKRKFIFFAKPERIEEERFFDVQLIEDVEKEALSSVLQEKLAENRMYSGSVLHTNSASYEMRLFMVFEECTYEKEINFEYEVVELPIVGDDLLAKHIQDTINQYQTDGYMFRDMILERDVMEIILLIFIRTAQHATQYFYLFC